MLHGLFSRIRPLGGGRRLGTERGWVAAGGHLGDYLVKQGGSYSLLIFSSGTGSTGPFLQVAGLAATAAEAVVFSGDINQYLCPSQEQAPHLSPRSEALTADQASHEEEERSGQRSKGQAPAHPRSQLSRRQGQGEKTHKLRRNCKISCG